jgi:pimeloyl-ACP methyl ester carboxylesterase
VLSVAAAAEAARLPAEAGYDDEAGYADDAPAPDLRAAAGLPDPRWIVRIATVRLMKDRAGAVGAHGVGPQLLTLLSAAEGARVHGIGHSYGSKVMLAALCALPQTRLHSLLLLQGAVNRYCFAEKAPGSGTSGAYRGALDRVVMPIVATRSDADWELRSFFHLALCRRVDVGELRMASLFDRYYALGGYGPEGVREHARVDVDLRRPRDRYPSVSPARLCSVNGSNGLITGHGDVDNEATAWVHAELAGGGFAA